VFFHEDGRPFERIPLVKGHKSYRNIDEYVARAAIGPSRPSRHPAKLLSDQTQARTSAMTPPSRCPTAEFRQAGVCTTPGSSARCEPGALCASCDCDAPLTCDPQGICGLPRAAGVCSDADVLSFLKLLQEKCGNVRNCESKDLDKHAIAYPDFLELIGRFPDTLAIHFPDGQPGPSADPAWPTTAESEHYINRLRTALAELEGAERIVLVALASRDRRTRDPEANRAITLRRLISAQNLISRAALTGLGAQRADALEGKISII
jgi:hypothetical protein